MKFPIWATWYKFPPNLLIFCRIQKCNYHKLWDTVLIWTGSPGCGRPQRGRRWDLVGTSSKIFRKYKIAFFESRPLDHRYSEKIFAKIEKIIILRPFLSPSRKFSEIFFEPRNACDLPHPLTAPGPWTMDCLPTGFSTRASPKIWVNLG